MSSSSSNLNEKEATQEDAPNRNGNKKALTHGFHMQIQVQQPKHSRRRKRKRDTSTHILSLSSSSSSSSEEEDNNDTTNVEKALRRAKEIEDKDTTASSSESASPPAVPTAASMFEGIKAVTNTINITEDTMNRKDNITKGQQSSSQQQQQEEEGWRVKLYRLNQDGSWDDCGTGRIVCLYKQQQSKENNTTNDNTPLVGEAGIYQELGEPTLCMHAEVNNHNNNSSSGSPRILLRTRILLRDAYQRQGDNIITWCEPYLEERNPTQGVDLALSFQDNAGCLDIWRQITSVQSKAGDLFRRDSGSNTNNAENLSTATSDSRETRERSVTNMALDVATAHHASLEEQEQQEMWANVASEHLRHNPEKEKADNNDQEEDDHHHQPILVDFTNQINEPTFSPNMNGNNNNMSQKQLPNPPTLGNLEDIYEMIADIQHVQQQESLAMYISQNECSYLKSLLSLFEAAESRGDYQNLASLAACVKTILLLNDPSIIELIINDENIFEEVCSTLEYDPDLRDKANHRWFLRERAKFRTVVLMQDDELISAIHRSFRVNYLRDTLLRPTMDESSLSTLSSLQSFTHSDVVKGVTMSPAGNDDKRGQLLGDTYLANVIRVLGRELYSICDTEWEELESSDGNIRSLLAQLKEQELLPSDPFTIVETGKDPQPEKISTIWKQHLSPQDDSLTSRRVRRRGSLSFLRELFNMVRISLQQTDKDDFFTVLVNMEVDLYDEDGTENGSPVPEDTMSDSTNEDNEELQQQQNSVSTKSVNLLSLLGTILSDPNTDVTEKGSVLEIIAGIAMHDPSLIRRRCLDFYASWKRENSEPSVRPRPNEKKQIIFQCPPNDLLASLLFLLAVETDAGLLLQVSEIMRIILDTDMMGDHGPVGAGFADEAEGIPPGHNQPHESLSNLSGSHSSTTDQNQFLSMFYDHYIQWLAAPFQYVVLHPVRRVPESLLQSESALMQATMKKFNKGDCQDEPLLHMVPFCAIRSSFAVELMSFCVRAHLYRMKSHLLRSGVLGNVIKLLKPSIRNASGDRCLKLAALR